MEPTPPSPVPGLILDVFVDAACTQRASGAVSELYVRLTNSSAVQDGYEWRGSVPLQTFADIVNDTDQNIFYLMIYQDFISEDISLPVHDGVYRCVSYTPIDVTGYQTEFYIDI